MTNENYNFMPGVGAIYQHYKGNEYEVLAIARDSETLDLCVVVRELQFGEIEVRPLKKFTEILEGDPGVNYYAFSYKGQSNSSITNLNTDIANYVAKKFRSL